ncbi:MAG: glycosyltransferase [Candidatus Sericytochromatia bacterium]|nr:glycosyltransferase [Candidatus Sericytochromatia bacterium]
MSLHRVLLLAPPFLPVPPEGYGGTERVVAQLARHLPDLGWQAEVFSAGHPLSPIRRPLGLGLPQPLAWNAELAHVSAAFAGLRSGQLRADLVHDHTRTAGLRAATDLEIPMLTTVHNDVDEDRSTAYAAVPDDRLVFLSRAHAFRYSRSGDRVLVIPNGIDFSEWSLQATARRSFLVFLGRLSREKGPARAVDIARQVGLPLLMGGGLDPHQPDYFAMELRPRLAEASDVRWLGEVHGEERCRLLGTGRALLAPLDWEEPFGLVLLEAMACGTPVLVSDRGAARELVLHGRSGWIVGNEQAWPEAVAWAAKADPRQVRATVEERFSAQQMARRYVGCYEALLARGEKRGNP